MRKEDVILGLPFSEVAAEAFELAGVEAQLVVPDPDRGTTHADVDRVEAFLGLTAQTPAVESAPAKEDHAVRNLPRGRNRPAR